MESARQTSELILRLEEQLGRFGVAGRIELDGTWLRLRGHGPTILLECPELASWVTATIAERTRIVDRVARELVRQRRSNESPVAARSRAWDWFRPVGILALTGLGVVAAWRWLGRPATDAVVAATRPPSSEASSNAPTLSSGAGLSLREGPAAERCSKVQSRISTGGSVSPLDVDGWLVELALMSSDPALNPTSPRLETFLAKNGNASHARRVIWNEDPELSAWGDSSSFAVVTEEPLVDVVAGTKGGVRIAWSGRYVEKYFDEAGRVRMQRLAAAMYEATDAQYGALYARCAGGAIHQIGSWFRGKDSSKAVLSLIGAMGLHARVVHLDGADPRVASPIEQRRRWDTLTDRAKRIDKQRLTMALINDEGLVASRTGSWVTVTFPYQDANRATRASLRIARSLGVAPAK